MQPLASEEMERLEKAAPFRLLRKYLDFCPRASATPTGTHGRFVRVSHELSEQKIKTCQKTGLYFGGDGETRTLAPVTRPTPLAGAPRHQLEYFSRLVSGFHLSSIFIFRAEEAVPVSLSTARDFLWRRGWDSNPRLLRVTSFQD